MAKGHMIFVLEKTSTSASKKKIIDFKICYILINSLHIYYDKDN